MNTALLAAFAPQENFAAALLSHIADDASDGSHDLSHIGRVWNNARRIQATEGGDLRILLAAVLLHDCVRVEKDSPLRAQASSMSARHAQRLLADMGWKEEEAVAVAHAVEAYSFSAGIAPRTLEAKIMQDADRLDAIGAIGVARCFYTAGRMGSSLYDVDDPQARRRALDDAVMRSITFQPNCSVWRMDFRPPPARRWRNSGCKRCGSLSKLSSMSCK